MLEDKRRALVVLVRMDSHLMQVELPFSSRSTNRVKQFHK